MEEEGQKIIFADLLESQFDGNNDDMLDWLNKYNRWKEVVYISRYGHIFKPEYKPIVVVEYRHSDILNLVSVILDARGTGDAKGLIFINNDFVGKEDSNSDEDFEIKWYVNGRLIDDEE